MGTAFPRRVARRWPLLPLRGRVPLLDGRFEDIPAGQVVETREGILVRVSPDPTFQSVYFWGDYEPYHTKIFRRIVRPGDVVFDVGANFGWYAALFARWVGTGGSVHAFEPVPFIHELATETLRLNGVEPRVRLNRSGLGRESGTMTIHTYEGLPAAHATAFDVGRADVVRHECRLQRLDEYCEEHRVGPIRFMKVDVEGGELDVFLGGERVLSRDDAPILAFELNHECLSRGSIAGADVLGALRGLGYTDLFTFSIRHGMRRLDSDDVDDAECLGVKRARLPELGKALATGRLLR